MIFLNMWEHCIQTIKACTSY